MVNNKIKIALTGIGGYGNHYIERLINNDNKGFELKGVVDPNPENCKSLSELKKRKIPIFSDLRTLFDNQKIDLTIVCSPIHYHVSQSKLALINGSNVLCEKPISPTVEGAKDIIRTRNKVNNKFVAIAYQWSFSKSMLALKKDIMSGLFGKPKKLKSIVLWPRSVDYYKRSNWAGKIKDEKGRYILDSVANNATAHFLHNMFFVLGNKLNKSAKPKTVMTELYRANNIENYDTAITRIFTENNVELLFYASHAVKENISPSFCYEFEKATIKYGSYEGIKDNNIVVEFKNGKEKKYESPDINQFRKLWLSIDAVRNCNLENLPCIPETALSHTKCINTMQENEIVNFPEEKIKFDRNKNIVWIKGLAEVLKESYQKAKMPFENQVYWAKCGGSINCKN